MAAICDNLITAAKVSDTLTVKNIAGLNSGIKFASNSDAEKQEKWIYETPNLHWILYLK